MCRRKLERMSDKYVIYYLQTRACVVEWPGQCHFLLCRWQSLKQSVWTDDRVMSERMPEDMPEKVPECLPECLPDRMPEDLPVTKRIDVMVGITRSKVIFAICFEEFDLTNPGFVLCFVRKADKFGIYNLCSVSVKQIVSKIVNEAWILRISSWFHLDA